MIVALMLLALQLPPCATAMKTPPAVYTDRGACPFEGCQYGVWTATVPTIAYSSASKKSRRLATLNKGTKVTALSGFVTSHAGRFRVTRGQGQGLCSFPDNYKPGDLLYVYTYQGEGVFLVWFDGKMYSEFVSGCRPNADESVCWGRFEKLPQNTWWVKARLADGRLGWLCNPEHFSGMDSLE